MSSYGEKGYAILFDLLVRLFRPSLERNRTLVHGLDADVFISEVLVLELAVLLIQDDLSCSRPTAITTLGDSDSYGTMAFPLDDGDELSPFTLATTHTTVLAQLETTMLCTECQPSIPLAPRPRPLPRPQQHHTPPAGSSNNVCSGDSMAPVQTCSLPPRIKEEEEEVVIPPADRSDPSIQQLSDGRWKVEQGDGGICRYELLSDDDD